MFKIYRVENRKDLKGPHHSSNKITLYLLDFEEAIDRHNTLCPLPFNDGLECEEYKERLFAVDSREQIVNDWTRKEMLKLFDLGFDVLEITVRRFISGNTYNVVFEREWILEQRIINQEILKMYEKDNNLWKKYRLQS